MFLRLAAFVFEARPVLARRMRLLIVEAERRQIAQADRVRSAREASLRP